MTKSIDHYILITDDLPAARDQYLRLGFNVLPIEKHIEFGSANAVVIFPNTYLELLDLGNSPPWLTDTYRPRLTAGPGLCHVSMTANTLSEEAERLRGLGYEPDQAMNARRKVWMPDGSQEETDSSSMYNWKSDRPYLSLFFSEHRKPETIFIEGHTTHPNRAVDTVRIVSVSTDPDADRQYYQDSADGPTVDTDDGGFAVNGFRGDTVEVMSLPAAQTRYPNLLDDLDLGDHGGFPIALHLSTSDIAQTRAHLKAQAVDFVEASGSLIVTRAEGVGCLILFEPTA